MESKLLKAVKEYSLIKSGDSIIAALSGGADSMALLCCLLSLRERLSVKLYACHVNHLLRGEESFRDESFVREQCKGLGVELFVLRCDIKKLALERNLGSEECGRQVRYDFLSENAERLHAKIATAHTASDSMETVLMNIVRGSGIKGARGIPPKRGNIIRPLILATRADTEEYCRINNIPYVNDSTNAERIYTRNKIRLDVVPILRGVNPSVEDAFMRFSDNMRELDAFMEDLAAADLEDSRVENGYSCEKLKKLPPPVFARVMELICGREGVSLDRLHARLMREAVESGSAVSVGKGVTAVSSQGLFRISRPHENTGGTAEAPVFINKTESLFGKEIETRLISADEYREKVKFTKNLFNISLDYDTIPSGAVFRARREGDIISPAHRGLTKPLRKLMSEEKIPSEKRAELILLAHESSVLWAQGLCVSEQCRVTADTKRVLTIYIYETGREV